MPSASTLLAFAAGVVDIISGDLLGSQLLLAGLVPLAVITAGGHLLVALELGIRAVALHVLGHDVRSDLEAARARDAREAAQSPELRGQAAADR